MCVCVVLRNVHHHDRTQLLAAVVAAAHDAPHRTAHGGRRLVAHVLAHAARYGVELGHDGVAPAAAPVHVHGVGGDWQAWHGEGGNTAPVGGQRRCRQRGCVSQYAVDADGNAGALLATMHLAAERDDGAGRVVVCVAAEQRGTQRLHDGVELVVEVAMAPVGHVDAQRDANGRAGAQRQRVVRMRRGGTHGGSQCGLEVTDIASHVDMRRAKAVSYVDGWCLVVVEAGPRYQARRQRWQRRPWLRCRRLDEVFVAVVVATPR